MRFRTLAVGAAMLAAAAFAPQLVTAAALPGTSKVGVENGSMVEQVRHRGHRHRGHRHHFHHRRHRHFHHHFRPRFYYYGGYNYGHCSRVRRKCAKFWGWGSRGFYRCVYSRGC